MQKLFSFELTMAIKDRSKVFQFITLALFSFSLTVILIGFVTRFSGAENNVAVKKVHHNTYSSIITVPFTNQLVVQK